MKRIDRLNATIERNTRALNRVATLLNQSLSKEDKQARLQRRRQELLAQVPYRYDGLMALKRQDLVMLARQLGIRDTAKPQHRLVAEVLEAQSHVPAQFERKTDE